MKVIDSLNTSASTQRLQILALFKQHKAINTTEFRFDSVNATLSDQIAVKTITPIQRSSLHPKSLRLAINAQCYDCIYDKSDAGTWRQQVAACPSANCPLYCQRPKPIGLGDTA
jgi:hypothetical protein